MQSVILISPLLNHKINFETQVEYAHVIGIIDENTLKYFKENHYCRSNNQITDFTEKSNFDFDCFRKVIFSFLLFAI